MVLVPKVIVQHIWHTQYIATVWKIMKWCFVFCEKLHLESIQRSMWLKYSDVTLWLHAERTRKHCRIFSIKESNSWQIVWGLSTWYRVQEEKDRWVDSKLRHSFCVKSRIIKWVCSRPFQDDIIFLFFGGTLYMHHR